MTVFDFVFPRCLNRSFQSNVIRANICSNLTNGKYIQLCIPSPDCSFQSNVIHANICSNLTNGKYIQFCIPSLSDCLVQYNIIHANICSNLTNGKYLQLCIPSLSDCLVQYNIIHANICSSLINTLYVFHFVFPHCLTVRSREKSYMRIYTATWKMAYIFYCILGNRHGSWIYNYECNQYLSPLTLWVRHPLMAKRSRYNIIW
jgi:hypothetical protein